MFVKNIKSNRISETQLQVLLGYAEEDIYDQSRQATAFGLLKVAPAGNVFAVYARLSGLTRVHHLQAILSRKLIVPEMEEVLKKVAKLSVTGSNAMIRIHCRQVSVRQDVFFCSRVRVSAPAVVLQIYLKYLLDYPLGKKLKDHLDFVVSQLPYEHEAGRESVLEMLAYIFQTFPQVRKSDRAGMK